MSVEALSVVLHHSRATGTDKLVLIGIANHDGDGGAWPAVATLSRYANVHERNVQRSLARLVQLGELVRHGQTGGLPGTPAHERPTLYEIAVTCPPGCDGSKNHRVTLAPPGDARATGGGGATDRGGVAPASPEPSLNHPVEPSIPPPSLRSVPPPAKSARATRIPENWTPDPSLIDWTDSEVKGSAVNPSVELAKFRDYWQAKGGADARKVDWPATWRNWIRRAVGDSGVSGHQGGLVRLPTAATGTAVGPFPPGTTTNDRVNAGLALAARLREAEQ